jgi:hypothetical protein
MNKRRKILLIAVSLAVVFALAVPVQAGPPLKYWHAKAGLIDLAHPVGTQWHELYPVFCTNYTLTSWEDNGDGVLSPCDTIDVQPTPDGDVEWYHVENVTITLYVTPTRLRNCFLDMLCENVTDNVTLREPMYIELEGGYNASALAKCVITRWHEIYPQFCRQYYLIHWKDNDSKMLDPCDHVLLIPKKDFDDVPGANPEDFYCWDICWHVEEVAIDIVVTPAPPVGGKAYPVNKASLLAPWIAVGVLLAGGTIWYVLRRRKAQN